MPGSNGSANGGAVTGAIGADENGVYGIPQQQPTTVIGADANGVYGVNPNTGGNNVLYQGSPNWTMPDNNQAQGGFKSVFGSDSNTGVFGSNPQSPVASSVDQALTGGGTITSASLYGQPQQQRQDTSNLRNIQEWIEADRAQGVTNPIISMMRYQAFMEPMEKQRREDNLRSAFATLRNPEATDADKLNAYALMEYELKKPGLKETMDWAQEQRQMARDEFGHKQELWPLQMEQARLGLDNTRSIINHRNFQDLGDYAGVNLEGKSWVRNNDGVDLSNAQPHTIAGLNHISDIFQQMTGKQLIVTSGNDGNMHAGGQFSHGKGWKVDVSGNGLEDPNIRHQFIQQCENLGIKVLDEYENPSPNSTGGHLDLQFSGYRGNVTGRRGKGSYGGNYNTTDTTSGTNTYYIDKAMGDFVTNPSGGVDNLAKSLIPKLREFSQKKGANARDELYKYLKNDKRVQGLMENAKNQNEVPDMLNDIVERTIYYAQNGTMQQYGNGDTPPQITGENKQEHGGGGGSGFADLMRDTRAYDDYNGQGVYNINDKRTFEPEPEDRYKYAYVRNLWQKGLENLERGRQIK